MVQLISAKYVVFKFCKWEQCIEMAEVILKVSYRSGANCVNEHEKEKTKSVCKLLGQCKFFDMHNITSNIGQMTKHLECNIVYGIIGGKQRYFDIDISNEQK